MNEHDLDKYAALGRLLILLNASYSADELWFLASEIERHARSLTDPALRLHALPRPGNPQ